MSRNHHIKMHLCRFVHRDFFAGMCLARKTGKKFMTYGADAAQKRPDTQKRVCVEGGGAVRGDDECVMWELTSRRAAHMSTTSTISEDFGWLL
jgi:hypothetical protein